MALLKMNSIPIFKLPMLSHQWSITHPRARLRKLRMAATRETVAETLSSFEERLRRVDYVLNGNLDRENTRSSTPSAKGSATARLRTLERSLQTLVEKSTTVNDILLLQKKHPELFQTSSSLDVPTSLPPSSLASLVLAHSQLYHSISSQLPQVQDTAIPDPSSAAKLIELRPRLERLQATQNAQAREFAELRIRSAKAVEAWYEGGVLGMGEQWAQWEERLRDAEIAVRRREAAKKRDEAGA